MNAGGRKRNIQIALKTHKPRTLKRETKTAEGKPLKVNGNPGKQACPKPRQWGGGLTREEIKNLIYSAVNIRIPEAGKLDFWPLREGSFLLDVFSIFSGF